MESPERIVEEDGYIFRIVSSRNISLFVLISCIVIYKLTTLQSLFFFLFFFKCCCLNCSHMFSFEVQVWFSRCPPPHVEKDVVELEKPGKYWEDCIYEV